MTMAWPVATTASSSGSGVARKLQPSGGSINDANKGSWAAGIRSLGLAEEGVGYAMDEHNANLVTADMQKRANKARADIIAGSLAVHDYMSNNSCTM